MRDRVDTPRQPPLTLAFVAGKKSNETQGKPLAPLNGLRKVGTPLKQQIKKAANQVQRRKATVMKAAKSGLLKSKSSNAQEEDVKAPSLGIEGGWLYKLKKGSRMYTISREADGTLVFKEGTFAGTYRD